MNVSAKTRVLIEGAMVIALSVILSYITFYHLPQGGAITLEMLPIVIMGLRNGTKAGCFTGFVHGVLTMILGFQNVLYCNTILAMAGCILLDYVLAFTVLGLAKEAAKPFSNKIAGIAFGTFVCGLLRFLCSFLSGWLLWGSYAPEGMGPVVYSFTYNASYMVPNTILACIIIVILYKTAPMLFRAPKEA